jgi:4-amino-4-deoxy-L-arabinose transferase-like glycosyltransferase
MGSSPPAAAHATPQTRAASLVRLSLLAIILLAFLLRTWDLDRLPPGLFFDEAYNAIDASQVIDGVARPIFFAGNNGREPLFIYLQSLAVALFGASSYSLRIVAAFAGVLTVPVIAVLTRRLLSWAAPAPASNLSQWREPLARTALVAAAALSISYWHVSLSRLGFRAILLPLCSALMVYFLARAWQENQRRDFILAGVWLGLAQYTYISARLLPLVIAGFIALELLLSLRRKSTDGKDTPAAARLANAGLMAGMALLVVAPLLWTFWQQPELVTARTGDVSIFAAESLTAPGTPIERLAGNLGSMAGAFFVSGDLNPRHNLPNRPINDAMLAVLFTAGVVAALASLRRPAHHLALLWFVVMLTPSIFSLESPHWLRMVGALPPLALLYAVGAQAIAAALARWVKPANVLAAILAAVVLFSGASTAYSYFSQWAQLPVLAGTFDADQYEAAERVRALLAEEDVQPILLTRRLFRSPQMRFLNGRLPGAAPRIADTDEWQELAAGTRYLVESGADITQTLFLIERQANGALGVTQLSPFDANRESIIAAILAGNSPFTRQSDENAASRLSPLAPRHETHLFVGETPALSLKLDRIQYPLAARFTNGVELVGYALPVDAVSCDMVGEELPLTFYLRRTDVGAGDDAEALLFAHLMLPEMQLQDNGLLGNGYPLTLWRDDDIVDDRRSFDLPETLTPGKAFFETGLFWLAGDGGIRRAGIVDGEGRIGGDQIVFGPLKICDGVADVSFDGLVTVGADFEGCIALDGVWIQQSQENPTTLQVELGWRAIDRAPTAYTAFVHLLDAADNIVAQHDFPVGGENNPTNLWVPGEKVRSTAVLTLPQDYAPVHHRLRIGLYEPVSGRQLAVTLPGQTGVLTYILLDVIE